MTKTFTPAARRHDPIEFTIDGPFDDDDRYFFAPPKIAGAMMPVLDPQADDDDDGGRTSMTQATWAWLRRGLGEDQYGRIRARLENEDDDLDVLDVAEMVRWLMSQVSGRPTTSRRG